MEPSNIWIDMGKFSYSKPDGSEDLLPAITKPEFRHSPKKVSLELFGGRSEYEKVDGSIEPRLYFVFSGGTMREKCFLQTLTNNKDKAFSSLQLVFLTSVKKDGGLTPKMMACQWQDIERSGHISQKGRDYVLESIDEVYMITDVDHYEKELRGILTSENHSCKWIISNPDIEVWLYYCFFDNPKRDLESVRMVKPSQRSSQMKAINAQLKNGGIDPRKAFFNMRTGIKNAKKFYEEDSIHFPSLFSTQMWRFCEDLDRVISEDFNKWHQAEIDRIRRFSK